MQMVNYTIDFMTVINVKPTDGWTLDWNNKLPDIKIKKNRLHHKKKHN